MTGPVAAFGPLVIETDVDRAVLRTLRLWMPTYLTRLERERELDAHLLARPHAGSYQNTLDDDSFPEGALPAILVTTANVTDTATTGDGVYLATWKVVVSCIVRGKDGPETRALAALFGGTVRRLLVDQSDLGGFAAEVRWVPGGAVAPVPDKSGQDRWLAAGINHFDVDVDDVLSTRDGPQQTDPIYTDPDPANDPDQTYDQPVPVDAVSVDIGTLD